MIGVIHYEVVQQALCLIVVASLSSSEVFLSSQVEGVNGIVLSLYSLCLSNSGGILLSLSLDVADLSQVGRVQLTDERHSLFTHVGLMELQVSTS